ncbi:MAG: hypothetical protein WC532_07690 [Candidatus Omnitrophota bacterium]
MVRKQGLLQRLEDALNAEEKSIPIYMKHLDSAIFWAGLDQDAADAAKKTFIFLAGESTRHKGIVEKLIKTITEDKRDAF